MRNDVLKVAGAVAGAMIGLAGLAAAQPAGDAAAKPLPVPSFKSEPAVFGIQSDPADSLYRAAQDALSRNEYRRAAELFRAVPTRFPRSRHVAAALYWEAFALYRQGGRENLTASRTALERHARTYPKVASSADARSLLGRVHGELARLGDPESTTWVREQASTVEKSAKEDAEDAKDKAKEDKEDKESRRGSQSCMRDGDDMRLAAINALQQMEDADAMPILREVLKKRGECTEVMRRKAVFIVAQTKLAETADVLLSVATTDPDMSVRKEAVRWLGDVRSDRAINVLDSILRSTNEDAIRDAALFALSNHNDPRARQAVRRYAESASTSNEGRIKAITYIGIHSGKPEDGTFLISLYPKLTDAKARRAVVRALGDIEVKASWDFLMRVAQDPGEDISVRKDALFWAEQGDIPTADLIAVENRLDDPKLREHYVFVLSQRNETAATDRLIAIARSHQDVEMRKKAIFWLGQKRDPRVRQILMEIINQ